MDSHPTYAIVALDGHSHTDLGMAHENNGSAAATQRELSQGLLLHYHVPKYLQDRIEPGHLVAVPLRGRPAYGLVTGLADTSPVQPTQPIARLVDARPVAQY